MTKPHAIKGDGCDKFASKLSSILGQVESKKMVATSSLATGEERCYPVDRGVRQKYRG